MHDVVIIGGGAIGLYLASCCDGLDVAVLEKNSRIGGHTCSGLYSTNLSKLIDVKEEWIENRVRSAVVHSPQGKEIRLEKEKTAAFVINRDKMESSLSEDVNIRLNTKVEGINIKEGGVFLKTNKGIVNSRMVVGCDGAYSVVGRYFGEGPKEIISGLIALTGEKNENDFVELWFNKDFAPDGFLWKIPRGRKTEYGMMAKNAKFDVLERFFKLKKGYEKKFGFIPIGPAGRTCFNRAILIGNAAGITKPWSGGGIIYGLTCARIAGEVIKNAAENSNFSMEFLSLYEEAWRKKIMKSINLGLIFRKIYKSAGNRTIEFFFRVFGNKRFNRFDMDYPTEEDMKAIQPQT